MRLGAIVFGLLIVLAIEGLLRLAGAGQLQDAGDPFVGFSDIVPLFELNEQGTHYEIASIRQDFFRPDSFQSEKSPDEFRIFCFGGSTVQGRPYAIETSFTRWLELSLTAADPSRKWRVVNCGGVSYASYRLVPILQETVHYKPDLFIIYTGHNEFLEERSYYEIKEQPAWLKSLHERAIHWRIYGVARQLIRPQREPTATSDLPGEVDALLDHQGGLERYHRDDEWHQGVVQHYEHNLRRMLRIARQENVPVILANPVSNIRGTPPFKAEVSSSLPEADHDAFIRQWEIAKQESWDDLDAKLQAVKHAANLAPRHAEAQFLLARVHEARGEFELAKEAYLRAKDEDICPLRMTEPMHAIVKQVARQTGTPLVDVRAMFEQQAKHGMPGDEQLIDHVHPRIEGHQEIADLLFEEMKRSRLVTPVSNWKDKRKQLYTDNFSLLPDDYFPTALSRLEGLNRWARGRVGMLGDASDEEK